MGLTPLDGVVHGTRSGSIDPSIIAHMKKALHRDASHVMDQLNKRSGLLGISGLSNDMRALHEAAAEGHGRAALAIDKFCYSVAKAAAGMVVSLGRLDALVFTGGIGENASFVRAKVCEALGFVRDLPRSRVERGPRQGALWPDHQARRPAGDRRCPRMRRLMIAMDTAEIIATERRAALIPVSPLPPRRPHAHTLVAPAGRQVGVTLCLGLVRALDRLGVRVAFTKPSPPAAETAPRRS